MTAVQLDFFGEREAELDAHDLVAAKREAHARILELLAADWVAPYDCSSGTRKGEIVPGYRCPVCRRIEPNEYLLELNHSHRGIGAAAAFDWMAWVYDRRPAEQIEAAARSAIATADRMASWVTADPVTEVGV